MTLRARDLYYCQQVIRIVQKGSFFSLLFTSCRVLHRWLQSLQDLGDFNPQRFSLQVGSSLPPKNSFLNGPWLEARRRRSSFSSGH